jgi:sarcosine oxidase/L-pipecolate oxidase
LKVTTALNLALRPEYSQTTITVLDRLPFPAVDGSSIDGSRIVRADYASAAYSRLCRAAQVVWRGLDASHPLHGIGDEKRYTQCGLVLVAESGGNAYVDKSYATVVVEGECAVELLSGVEDVRRVCKTGGCWGHGGYVNWSSGWADAEAAMRFLRRRVEATGNVGFETGEVVALLEDAGVVRGVRLRDGREIGAELTVLATGAWTPGLVDLAGRSVATGQVLGYLRLPDDETLKDMPVVFNLSTGIFAIRQHDNVLKIARHATGYVNPVTTADGRTISTPRTAVTNPGLQAPKEAVEQFRAALKELCPSLTQTDLERTRLCWYNDTATGDFIVDYHPEKRGLFLATGGSGHAFKFLPVLGEHIVDILAGVPEASFRELWKWPAEEMELVVNKDGSRGDDGLLMLDESVGEEFN